MAIVAPLPERAPGSFAENSADTPMDYLVFRVYEAAKKLISSADRRIAVVIVSDYELSYEIPLSENWIERPMVLVARDARAERSSASIQQVVEHGLPAGAEVDDFVPVPGQFRAAAGHESGLVWRR